ncbi:MAG: response regulator transcription factor, partial [Promethearchaeota archaeon]
NIIASAKNGVEAVNIFKNLSQKPDFILMDYIMPFKNGIEATEEILKLDPKAKIIIMSSDFSAKEKALSAGAICFSEKVLPFKTFLNKIKSKICP